MTPLTLIGLFFCHFLADFTPLSTKEMLSAKRFGTPLIPIAAHAAVHGILMFFFLLLFGVDIELAMNLWLFQIATHFLIDLLKGKLNFWFPIFQDNTNKAHWMLFGFDQFLHAVVIILMAYYLTLN